MTLKLVQDSVSHDTLECLETLADAARNRSVIGIAFVALLPQRKYIVNTAGGFHSDPTMARGCLAALDDELSEMIRGIRFQETQ